MLTLACGAVHWCVLFIWLSGRKVCSMKTLTYEEVLDLPRSDDKLKGFEFIVEDILRAVLKTQNPAQEGIAYYDRMGFLSEYETKMIG